MDFNHFGIGNRSQDSPYSILFCTKSYSLWKTGKLEKDVDTTHEFPAPAYSLPVTAIQGNHGRGLAVGQLREVFFQKKSMLWLQINKNGTVLFRRLEKSILISDHGAPDILRSIQTQKRLEDLPSEVKRDASIGDLLFVDKVPDSVEQRKATCTVLVTQIKQIKTEIKVNIKLKLDMPLILFKRIRIGRRHKENNFASKKYFCIKKKIDLHQKEINNNHK